jgi:hypothetical protein
MLIGILIGLAIGAVVLYEYHKYRNLKALEQAIAAEAIKVAQELHTRIDDVWTHLHTKK